MDNEFHTIIVGSGSGGLTVAVGLSKLGKKIALIEKDHIGGDCTNVGCVPSKTLIHASEHVGGEIGLEPEEVLEWVRERRDDLRDEETEFVEELPNVTLIRGHARFVDSKRLEVTSRDGNIRVVSARNIVLATGSSPRRLRRCPSPCRRRRSCGRLPRPRLAQRLRQRIPARWEPKRTF